MQKTIEKIDAFLLELERMCKDVLELAVICAFVNYGA